jgi:hypothetical protein
MPQSETIGKLAQAIAQAQAELKPVKREAKNPFFNSKYADLASIWEALKPFHAHGIAISQIPFDAGEGMIGIETQLSHESGEWIAGKLALPVSKEDAQGVGSAITYARRYALGCMTGVVTEDDDDGNHAAQAKPVAQRFTQQKATIARAFQEIRQDVKHIAGQTGTDLHKGGLIDVEQDGASMNKGGSVHDLPGSVMPSKTSDAAPPSFPPDDIPETTWGEFLEYVGDDPERTKVGKAVKKRLAYSEMSKVPAKARRGIMLTIQDEAKRQGIPFEQWVQE